MTEQREVRRSKATGIPLKTNPDEFNKKVEGVRKRKREKKKFSWRNKKTRKDFQEDLIVSLISLLIFLGLLAVGVFYGYSKVVSLLS